MNEVNAALFTSSFQSSLVQFEALVLLGLCVLWLDLFGADLIRMYSRSALNRMAVLGAGLFGIIFAVSLFFEKGAEMVLLATSIGLALTLSLLHSTIGLSLLCSVLFLRPWELIDQSDYLQLLPKFCFVICTAHAFLQLASRRSRKLVWNDTATFVMGLGIWAYVATFKAADFAASQVSYYDTLFKSILFFLLILNTVWTRKDLDVIIESLLVTFVGVICISLYQTVGLSHVSGVSIRLAGIGAFSNPNDIAALMVLIFPFALMRILRKSERPLSYGLSVAVIALTGPGIWLSQSRGAMLAMAAALGVYLIFKVKKRSFNVAFICSALILGVLYSHFSSRSGSDLDESSASRWSFIKAGLNMAYHNPVLGVGFDEYQTSFEKYVDVITYEYGNHTAHNSWILVLAETGIPGLLFFVACFVSVFIQSGKIFSVYPEFLAALTGYGFAVSFLSHSYLLYPYLLFGLIGVAYRVAMTPIGRVA